MIGLTNLIIATCSVPAIPRAWLDQTRIGGLILADLKLSVLAGNLVLLTRLTDRAEGRFDRTWAGFMALRPNTPATATPTVACQRSTRDRAQATQRTTDLDQLRPWDNLVVWFTPLWRAVEGANQLWHELGQPRWDRFGLTATTELQWIWLDSPDGDHTWPLTRPKD